MLNDAGIRRGQIVRYTLTPQIFPRLKKLVGSGFPNLSYFVAVVFNTLRILPRNHPYLRADMHGKFSVLQALGAAAGHIPFNKKNIDKIAIFGVVLSGIVMLALQMVLWVFALIGSKSAYAYSGPGLGPRSLGEFFGNASPQDDLAFRFLDLVFGVPGVFNSSDMDTTPLHAGLHALFEFYSYGILLVGSLVIIYLAFAIVMETAEEGVPFGKRFNKPWAPVRLILFFGLLLPMPSGLNMAQYVVLNAAKYGSNLATNAWITFDAAATGAYLGSAEQLVAEPNAPDLSTFAGFMALAKTCSWAEGRINGLDIRPYYVYEPTAAGGVDMSGSTPAFSSMVQNSKGGSLVFRFGVQDDDLYGDELGAVFPYCGELSLTVTDQDQPGAALIQQAYVEMIGCMWDGRAGSAIGCQQAIFNNMGRDYTSRYSVVLPYNPHPDMTPYVGDTQKTAILVTLNEDFQAALTEAIQEQVTNGEWGNSQSMKYGWAGTGIWYNKIAEMNGALTSAVFNKPEISALPYVMEHIKREKQKDNINTPLPDLYTPLLTNGRLVTFESPQQREVAIVLNQLFTYWGSEQSQAFFRDVPETHNQASTGNIIIDTVNLMMGTRGLFDMCKNTNIHPLAQMSSLGRGLIEHSIRGFGAAAGFGIAGGLAGLLHKHIGAGLQGASKFFMTFATIGLMLGFMLFYVLPFIPFIYFFFAVMTWVKGIFEAMVGMPLWALAHLKIDGDGMPGDSAATGYFNILEIFLRPICILIGFLGGILIFSASVKVLNSIFYLVISNLSGHYVSAGITECFQPPASAGGAPGTDALEEALFKRGVIDEFFYTVVYTVIVFMMALPCFKLVDLIPDYVQRWLGSGVTAFGAQDGDPADNMMAYIAGGAATIGGKLQGVAGIFGFK